MASRPSCVTIGPWFVFHTVWGLLPVFFCDMYGGRAGLVYEVGVSVLLLSEVLLPGINPLHSVIPTSKNNEFQLRLNLKSLRN